MDVQVSMNVSQQIDKDSHLPYQQVSSVYIRGGDVSIYYATKNYLDLNPDRVIDSIVVRDSVFLDEVIGCMITIVSHKK